MVFHSVHGTGIIQTCLFLALTTTTLVMHSFPLNFDPRVSMPTQRTFVISNLSKDKNDMTSLHKPLKLT